MHFFWNNVDNTGGAEPYQARQLTAVIGSGLMGSSVINLIKNHSDWQYDNQSDSSIPWNNQGAQLRVLRQLHDQLIPKLLTADSIEVIWSAGKAGFSCTQSEAENELSNFKTIIGWVSQLKETCKTSITVNLISSLGGLFEKADVVRHNTQPQPNRAYGFLKLEQEKLLQAATELNWRIYRVSSAYGPIATHNRMGLIPTLMLNAYRQKSTHIYGYLNTRRDYVWVDDVTQYLVSQLHTQKGLSQLQALASYESFSIAEIKHKVEQTLQRTLNFTFSNQPDNGESISISPCLRPVGFQTSNLQDSIKKIHAQYLQTQP